MATSQKSTSEKNTAAKTVSNSTTHDGDSPIADKVSETLHHSVDSLAEHTSVAEEKLRQAASSSVETMTDKQQQAKDYWDNSAVGKYTKENPVKTAGIAFAAGMLLTTLLRKK